MIICNNSAMLIIHSTVNFSKEGHSQVTVLSLIQFMLSPPFFSCLFLPRLFRCLHFCCHSHFGNFEPPYFGFSIHLLSPLCLLYCFLKPVVRSTVLRGHHKEMFLYRPTIVIHKILLYSKRGFFFGQTIVSFL